ncbi:hypothetical protein B0H13DRAFT_1911782 [Mycena leptocephala]|nr:hypothetical protein B0H13DRAFT_1911782 [Mycena leptocephala]
MAMSYYNGTATMSRSFRTNTDLECQPGSGIRNQDQRPGPAVSTLRNISCLWCTATLRRLGVKSLVVQGGQHGVAEPRCGLTPNPYNKKHSTENIVQLASAGVNLPEIHAGNHSGTHAVDSAKRSGALHYCSSKMQNCEKAGLNTENIVRLASAGVNLPEIYAENPPGVHAVDSAKKIGGHSTPAARRCKSVRKYGQTRKMLCNLVRRVLICLKFMLETLPVFTPSIQPKKNRWALHSCGSKMQNCEKAGPNTENIVELASAGGLICLQLPTNSAKRSRFSRV